MKLQPYQRYKPSGVEWLGDIAQDWSVSLIKHLVSTPVTDGPHETPEIVDEGIPFVSAEAISGKRINFGKIRGHITADDHKRFSRKYKPRRGDIYLVKSGATTGRVAMVETDIEFNIWSPLAAIRCEPRKVDKQFLFFYVQSKEFQTAVELSWSFGTQQNIGMGVIQNLAVPLPSLAEQRSIAAFLDRETGRIDTLAAKKRELIERLKEKRTALISRTVTKGLPPAAARAAGFPQHPLLKPSGVPWTEEIPKHWESGNLRRFATMRTGHTPSRTEPEYWADCTIPWFTLADVWQLRDDKRKYLGETNEMISELGLANSAAELLPEGTVIFSRTASIGFSGIMPVPMATTQDFWNWICGPKLRPEYLLFLFRTMRQEFERLVSGSTHKTIYQPDAASLRICVPPLSEQAAIAAYLDAETAKLDALVSKVEMAIERLQEYRTALITAAVTGKIDVRKQVNQ